MSNLLAMLQAPAEFVRPGRASTADMIWVPSGTFRMGSDRHYSEEGPAHDATVNGFWIDPYPVTNEQFSRFVDDTGYVTFAELPPNPADYPGALPEMMYAGSLVFTKPPLRVPLHDSRQWWSFKRGAQWRHPRGTSSSLEGLRRHPVVHVTYGDAAAYALWAGKELPTEVEWERAARGGLHDAEYAWGDELVPDGRHRANTWQGEFPWQNERADGYDLTSPVDAFPPNAYGVHDMIGNVWEWTTDWYRPRHSAEPAKACCSHDDGRASCDARDTANIPRKVLKGGSHLCSPNYCQRYRPAARFPEPIDTSASHVGFRCILRVPEP